MKVIGATTKGLRSQGGAGISVAYLTGATDVGNNTIYTFPALSFGDADATREIYACVFANSNFNGGDNPSVTIGGENASLVVGEFVAGAAHTSCHIYKALVPTGTSGDLVVTYANSKLRAGAYLYRVTGEPTTATASASGTGNTVSDITPASGSLVISAGACEDATALLSFNGITEDAEDTVEAMKQNCGSGDMPATLEWVRASGDGLEWACCAVGLT